MVYLGYGVCPALFRGIEDRKYDLTYIHTIVFCIYLYCVEGYIMKTIVDLDEDTLREVMEVSKSKTKKGAIVTALNEYLRLKKRQELKSMIGNYKEFDLTRDDLRKMRHGR